MAFHEKQRFPIGLFLAASVFVLGTIVTIAVFAGDGAPLPMLVTAFGSALLVALTYFLFELRTEVTRDDVRVQLAPFPGSTIPADQIRSVQVVRYRPIRDFGGWGLRYGRMGKMLNARGDTAVKFELAGSQSLFIGSQRPEDLKNAVDTILKP